LGSSFQLVIQVRIEATSSRTERWALRLIHFVVSSANQRSTRFNQELLDEVQPGAVGRHEVEREAGVATEPALDRRGLVGGGVVEHGMHVEVCRDRGVDQVEEAAELFGA
jgi:hypothetical protein